MNAIRVLMLAVAVPLLGLSELSSLIIGGIWLAILGEWRAIGWGFAATIISTLGFNLALMPGTALSARAVHFGKQYNSIPMYFFALLSNFYTVAVITAWSGFVLYFFARRADSNSLIPLLLWSYWIAINPFSYRASKDGGPASITVTVFTEIGYIIMVIMVLFINASLVDALAVFLIVMLVGLLVQFSVAIKLQRDGAPLQ